MVGALKNLLQQTPLTALSLFMLSSNQTARNFYENQGFITVKKMPGYYASLNNADGEELRWVPLDFDGAIDLEKLESIVKLN